MALSESGPGGVAGAIMISGPAGSRRPIRPKGKKQTVRPGGKQSLYKSPRGRK